MRRNTANTSVNRRLRFSILKRDRFRCLYCGRTASEVTLQVDHVLPINLGGTHDPSNLATACKDCNVGKGNTAATPPNPLSGVALIPKEELPPSVPNQDRWLERNPILKTLKPLWNSDRESAARVFLKMV